MKAFYLSVIAGGGGKADAGLRKVLEASSALYGAGAGALRMAYDRGWLAAKRLPIPVVSIGNLTWGGTGKTPLVMETARKILELKKKALILTRGYGNDESREMAANLTGAKVVTGKDRWSAGSDALKSETFDIALCDDAFQHRALYRDWDIVAVDAVRPFGNGFTIPRGELREPVAAAARAQAFVLTRADKIPEKERDLLRKQLTAAAPSADWFETAVAPALFHKASGGAVKEIEAFRGVQVSAFCGIGSPANFRETLEAMGARVSGFYPFPDHHVFRRDELEKIKAAAGNAPVITTEKDYFRMPELVTEILDPWILRIHVRFLEGGGRFAEKLGGLLERGAGRKNAYV